MAREQQRHIPETEAIKKREAAEFDPAGALKQAGLELVRSGLSSPEEAKALRRWQELKQKHPAARQTVELMELLSGYERAAESRPERAEKLEEYIEKQIETRARRTKELFSLFTAGKFGQETPAIEHPEVERIYKSWKQIQTREGALHLPELLTSARASVRSKSAWLEARVLPAVEYLSRRDFQDWQEEIEQKIQGTLERKQQNPEELTPPPPEEDFTPSMEELEPAREGEASAFFTIRPFYGGYYRGEHYDRWNAKLTRWERSQKPRYEQAEPADLEEKSRRTVSGIVAAGRDALLPLPYEFDLDSSSLKSGADMEVLKSADGGYGILRVQGGEAVPFTLKIGKLTGERPAGAPTGSTLFDKPPELGTEADEQIKQIQKSGGTPYDQARELKRFVRDFLEYSNDSAMNAVYQSGDPEGYFQRIEEHKKADCDVANTYFTALLARAGIPARLVTGYYVKVKNHEAAAVISSGTGHAWTEVWDGEQWRRLDATPPGDPNMDEEEVDELEDDSVLEGDWGEQEAPVISDEEMAELLERAEKFFQEAKDQTPEEKRIEYFAGEAGSSIEEAREILRAIETARQKRDSQGRLIRSRLLSEWQRIIQANLVERARYKTPIRMSRGDDLAEPVEAVLEMKSGEADPTGFARYEREKKREQSYGGFDIVVVADKSGSMDEPGAESGKSKWQEQQELVFLLMDSLYAASQEFKRQKIKLISPLDIRTALISFNAGSAVLEKDLGEEWGPKEQYRVWQALRENVGGGTPDHLGLSAAAKLLEEDRSNRPGTEKQRMQIVLVSADGGSDNKRAVMAAKERLKETRAVVKAAGIGLGAREVESTYYPDGENLADFSAVPEWAAEQVITEAKKLYPKRVK